MHDPATGKKTGRIAAKARTADLAFTPDNRYLLSADATDSKLRMWELASGTDVFTTQRRATRPYTSLWTGPDAPGDKIGELLNHRKALMAKVAAGESLTNDEHWELRAIEDVLKNNKIDIYTR